MNDYSMKIYERLQDNLRESWLDYWDMRKYHKNTTQDKYALTRFGDYIFL